MIKNVKIVQSLRFANRRIMCILFSHMSCSKAVAIALAVAIGNPLCCCFEGFADRDGAAAVGNKDDHTCCQSTDQEPSKDRPYSNCAHSEIRDAQISDSLYKSSLTSNFGLNSTSAAGASRNEFPRRIVSVVYQTIGNAPRPPPIAVTSRYCVYLL